MRRLLLLFVLSTTFFTTGGPFVRIYKAVPLAKALQEIEAHFSLQLIYRPQDIANAPAVNCTVNTTDYQAALRKVLGNNFTYTVKNNIVVIKAVPPQPQAQSKPASPAPSQSKPKPVTNTSTTSAKSNPKAGPDGNGNDKGNNNDNSVITPTNDSGQVSENTVQNDLPSLPPAITLQPLTLPWKPPIAEVRIPRKFRMPKVSKRSPTADRSNAHAFQTAVTFGYGSELLTQLDLRYSYYFHPRWGVGAGLNFAYAVKIPSSSDVSRQQEEGRLGLPIVLNTRYPIAHRWGVRATVGAIPSFRVFTGRSGTGISNSEIDVIPFLEVDAQYVVSEHIDLLFGLYTHISAISVSPWSVGVHFGVEIGN